MKTYKIALTGVESVGKTTLTKYLTSHYEAVGIYEYAREYLAHKPHYNQDDVIKIAEKQIALQNQVFDFQIDTQKKIVFYDTELTVIKIWYETKYQTALPTQIMTAYQKQIFDLYLLPYPDLTWEADNLRETPHMEARFSLFEKYEQALKEMKRPYKIIKGQAEERYKQAIQAVNAVISE